VEPSLLLGRLRLRGAVMVAAGVAGMEPATPHQPPQAAGAPPALGGFVTAGVAHAVRRGPAARLMEAPAGALFDAGAARRSVRETVRRHERAWAVSATPVIVHLAGDTDDELAAAAAHLEGVPGVAAVELHLAPLLEPEIAPAEEQPAAVAAAIAAVQRTCGLAVVAKLPFDVADPARCIRAAAAAGASAVTLAGGIPLRQGVLVGPAAQPQILDLISRVAPGAALPVIACGGIAGVAHARAYLRAGAAAVQVGSALLANPLLAHDIAAEV
jgi:dihydroorotate dehydrogenase (NAD+) catalytic subunit